MGGYCEGWMATERNGWLLKGMGGFERIGWLGKMVRIQTYHNICEWITKAKY